MPYIKTCIEIDQETKDAISHHVWWGANKRVYNEVFKALRNLLDKDPTVVVRILNNSSSLELREVKLK